ncbi:TetR/AcrR family transcriptional regulator [Terrabacter sp. MAHUQ-38]|uniref:TetR/AcrR family transcriptional regulator n=1 Tax=unclassified Terrabacter TaxID=2630222 RepID=UPI00165DF15E|nr:TetR/AcrR family transcriptional regulator [Terrabacter sp. MAHUQ-38]MBC9822867.1 TetR/AcrR family transcriptional regulator [Terrabacter sp. MAHUQ-38]
MGTKPGSARQRLLAAAAECFYAHGVSGTGIDTLTSTAGVAKMSLYNNFASKDELVLAYLQERHEEWLELYSARLAATDGSGRAGVGAVFDAYVDHANAAYTHGFRGCGLLNAAAELPAGAPGREQVRHHKEQVEQLVAEHLARIETLPADRVDELALQLSFALEGAMARAGLEGRADLLVRARDLALKLVDQTAATFPVSPTASTTAETT